MRRKKAVSLSVAIVLLIIYAVSYIPQTSIETHAVVTRVIDGDTIVIEGGDRVRLLDIDTPEKGEPCSTNATNRLKELIDGKEITLVSGKEDKDVYDRLLRYIFINDTFVNLLLVREGWANLYVVNKNPDYYPMLVEAEQAAKSEGLCVWTRT